MAITPEDQIVAVLRKDLCSEDVALAKRFRALFSLKHLASQSPATPQSIPAVEAIAAAFTSPSALLKHELAYCLGQSGKEEAIPFLRAVIEDRKEDPMCRHEAAEALGALGDQTSLPLLRERRDDKSEEEVVRETCEIAIERLEWESSEAGKKEKLKQRYVWQRRAIRWWHLADKFAIATSLPLIQRLLRHWTRSPILSNCNENSWIHLCRYSSATEPCSRFETWPLLPIYQPRFPPLRPLQPVSRTPRLFSDMKLLSSLANCRILLRSLL